MALQGEDSQYHHHHHHHHHHRHHHHHHNFPLQHHHRHFILHRYHHHLQPSKRVAGREPVHVAQSHHIQVYSDSFQISTRFQIYFATLNIYFKIFQAYFLAVQSFTFGSVLTHFKFPLDINFIRYVNILQM